LSIIGKLIAPGLLLFIDSVLLAFVNWIYWLVISKFALASEVGQATTVYSLVVLISILIQLGLEYPLLKHSHTQGSRILGTSLGIELILSIATLPLLLYTINTYFHQPAQSIIWLAIGMLFFSSVSFVTRYILLGISDVKSLVYIDLAGVCLKFVVGYTLVLTGFGVFGILVSFLLYFALVGCATLIILLKKFGFVLDRSEIKLAKEITKSGLVNTPFKLSKVVIISLSVILLTPFGINNSDIGIFYITLMISIVAGSLASSIAFMVIPASTKIGRDLASPSLRIALGLTAPIISTLIVAPKFVLSIIGTQYISGDTVLLLLAIGILPFAVTFNAISGFNNNGQHRKIIVIGCIEFFTFLIGFFFLVPYLGIIGAAFSVMLAFLAASIPSIIWLGSAITRYVANPCVAIIIGIMAGFILGSISGMHPVVQIIAAFLVTSILVIALKTITLPEIQQTLSLLTRKDKL
jgi:O-antigen/teichoic acid export membrane protein